MQLFKLALLCGFICFALIIIATFLGNPFDEGHIVRVRHCCVCYWLLLSCVFRRFSFLLTQYLWCDTDNPTWSVRISTIFSSKTEEWTKWKFKLSPICIGLYIGLTIQSFWMNELACFCKNLFFRLRLHLLWRSYSLPWGLHLHQCIHFHLVIVRIRFSFSFKYCSIPKLFQTGDQRCRNKWFHSKLQSFLKLFKLGVSNLRFFRKSIDILSSSKRRNFLIRKMHTSF